MLFDCRRGILGPVHPMNTQNLKSMLQPALPVAIAVALAGGCMAHWIAPPITYAQIGTGGLSAAGRWFGAASVLLFIRFVIGARSGQGSELDIEAKGSSREDAWALFGAIAIGLVLRAAHLGDYTLNPDESIFVGTAGHEGFGAVWDALLINHHPPANFFGLHLMLKVSRAALWLRLPSLVSGVYLIWIGHRLGRELFGARAGMVLAVMIAFSPGLVELSRVCRDYMPGLALLVTALYFFARYLNDGQWRGFAICSVFELLASAWTYPFVIVFFTIAAVTVWRLAVQRQPPSVWLRFGAAQVPLFSLLAFFYFFHIRIFMHTPMAEWVINVLRHDEFFVEPSRILMPLISLWRYLLAGDAGLLLFGVGLIGLAGLARQRRTDILLLSVIPVALAYGFMLAHRLPLGGSRHSVGLFPILFIWVAAALPAAGSGFAGMLSAIFGRGASAPDGAGYRPPPARASGKSSRDARISSGIVLLTALVYANMAFAAVEGRATFYRQIELPTPRAQLDRTLEMLAEQVAPDDIILVSYQGLTILHLYLLDEPVAYEPGKAVEFEHEGLRFYYSTEAGWYLTPASFIRSYAEFLSGAQREAVPTVWAIRGAGDPWEPRLDGMFDADFPDAQYGRAISERSDGWLFSMPGASARAMGGRLPEKSDSYSSDFIRSQIEQ